MTAPKNKLIDERPLIVLPSLATQCGLFGAIFIQQLHHNLVWIVESIEKEHDTKALERLVGQKFWTAQRKEGKKKIADTQARLWYRCTPTAWLDEFPWSSQRTLKRTVSLVRGFGVLTARRPGNAYDQTNYYSLDYDLLRKIGIYLEGQVDPIQRAILALSMGPSCPDPKGQDDMGNHTYRQISDNNQPSSCCDDASENQTPSPEVKIDFPENLTDHKHQITTILQEGKIDFADRQVFVSELSEALSSGKIKKTVGGYARGMITRGWQPSQEAQQEKQNDDLISRLEKLKHAFESGQEILLDGHPVTPDPWPHIQLKDGLINIAELIKQGAKIEIRKEAA